MKAFFKGFTDMIGQFEPEEVEIIKKHSSGVYFVTHSQGFERDGVKQIMVLPEHLGFESMKKENKE